jgi:hypothetical protein
MDVQCTNIHNGVYIYHNGFSNVQIYTMMCTHITLDVQYTNIHNSVYTYHNRFAMYKYIQLCVHISQWTYNV